MSKQIDHIAIQGIKGSYHHAAAVRHFQREVALGEYMTFRALAEQVAKGTHTFGLMAIENSIAGALLPNYALINEFGLYICGEVYLHIHHHLMALPGTNLAEVKEVKSHPMAILQCEAWFDQHPHIRLVEDHDTADSARRIAEEQRQGEAAIASLQAAKAFGLEILADDIQTIKHNYTRFFVVSSKRPSIEDSNKASLKLIAKHESGSLAKILVAIAEFGFDMTKIQSVPIIDKPWEYSFYIDIKFDKEARFRNLCKTIEDKVLDMNILGVYQEGPK